MKDWLFLNFRSFIWLLVGAVICLYDKDFAIRMVKAYGLLLKQEIDEKTQKVSK